MNKTAILAATLLASALTGCTTPVGPVEVNRFYRPELTAATRGAVSILPAQGNSGDSLEFRSFAAAVGQELGKLGYSEAAGGNTVAVVDVQRQTYRGERERGPVSIGIGGSTGGGWHSGVGVGLGLGFNLGGGPKEQVETRLSVTIRDRTTGQSLWEGRARYVVPAGSPAADNQLGAAKMAQALFQGFPGKSGETILVK